MPLSLRSIEGDTLVAGAIGGAARFGERLRAYVPLSGAASGSTLRYDLLAVPKLEKGEKVPKTPYRQVQSGLGEVRHGRTIGPAIVDANDIRFVMQNASTSDSMSARTAGAIIDARIDELSPGDYVLL